jgi:serine/threonine-protein kinase
MADDEQTQIDQLLDAWEASCETGDPEEVETLCQDHPELVEEVRQRVAALEAVDRKLNSRKKDRLRLEPLQIESKVDDLHFVSAGGLGEVFVGEDSDLHRRVAIKFMHSRLCGDEDSRGRFLLEAEVTGRLEHPGVVPLYGFGCTEDDRLFYAMRFIDGETLDDAIKRYYAKADHSGERRTDEGEIEVEFRRLLANFISVCKTIAYAHNRGIVHRDIKPANVMLGRFGETIVVDWGLAVPVSRGERFRSSGEQTLMPSSSSSSGGSSSGRGAGTPAFMSPEQASELAPTPASDIYSLGATLFKVLCGKPPVTSKSLQEIRNNLIDGKLPLLSEMRGDIPQPLQAIAYKAMARHAKDRYPTALELAQDVERYLADEPVTAADDSLSVRLARIARKHRAAAQAAVLGLCGCLLIAGVSALVLGGLANNAQKLRNQNLTTSSRLIARSFGQEVDRIWRILESLADSSQLRTMLMAANQLGADGEQITLENQAEVQAWLEDRLGAERYRILDRLVVLSQDGTQIARAPLPPEPQVGQNFAYRGYFTGLGFDLEPGSNLNRPLSGPKVHPSGVHMSSAYLSTQADEQRLKVTFTVPVFSEDQSQCIGVVGTSMDVGDMMRKLLG